MLFRQLLLGAVLLVLGIAPALAYEHQYIAQALPENSVPPWALVAKQGTAEVVDGKLRAEVEAGQRRFYAIGLPQGEKRWGDADAWNMSPGNARVEVRLRCSAALPEQEVFRLIIRDGIHQWQVPFSCIKVGRADADTTEWDTYKIDIENGRMRISSERRGTLARNLKGAEDARANALMFGSYFYAKDESTDARGWEVEFIRWTSRPAPSDP